jgi:hypothetical protein
MVSWHALIAGTNAKRSTWAIDTTQLTVSKEYTISVTVSGTAGAGDDRTATASLIIRPEAGNPPTGAISRFCGFDPIDYSALPCAPKHNPTQDLILNLDLDDGFEEASVQWSSNSLDLQENINAVVRFVMPFQPALMLALWCASTAMVDCN